MRSANAPAISAGVIDGEGELEHRIYRFWNGERQMRCRQLIGVLHERHTVEQGATRSTEVRGSRRESPRITDEPPQQGDDTGDREALHQGRQHILLADHAAVEEREARYRHQ